MVVLLALTLMLSARGIMETKGNIYAVEQFTLSGNIINLLQSIVAIGKDLKWVVPNKSNYGSPSILFSNVMVSGKEASSKIELM